MLKWVYEFDQEKLLALQTEEYKITPADVLILHSIVNSVCSVKMQTIFENGKMYVWIDHKHLLESLPILNISDKRLYSILKKFRDMGLIETKTVSNHKLKGSKSFIALSDILLDCVSEKVKSAYDGRVDQCLKMSSENRAILKNEHSSNTQYNSNNKELSKDNSNISKPKISNTNSFLRSAGKKKSKKFTYQDCIVSINSFTDDIKLRQALIDYLNYRLSIMKDKPMRMIQWKSMLVTLTDAYEKSSDGVTMSDIVRRALEKGYTTFYPINYSAYNNHGIKSESGARHVPRMTEEDYAEEEQRLAELEAKGVQVRF